MLNKYPDTEDFKFIASGSDKPVVVLRHFMKTLQWCVFYEHEANYISTYDGLSKTPEEAIEKFIKYRINGDCLDRIQLMGNWTTDVSF